jgi:uncharacterized RDD family membrane protein YckC
LEKLSQLSMQVSAAAAPAVTKLKSAMEGDATLPVAGFWRRTFAFCLDMAILTLLGTLLIVLPLQAAFQGTETSSPMVPSAVTPEAAMEPPPGAEPAFTAEDAEALMEIGGKVVKSEAFRGSGRSVVSLLSFLWEAAAALFALFLVAVALFVLLGYYAGFESSRLQATPGKLLLRIKVAGVNGQPVSYARAAARNLAKVSFFLFPLTIVFLGYALFSKRRGLHDLFSGCKILLRRSPAAQTFA